MKFDVLWIDDDAETEKMKSKFDILESNGFNIISESKVNKAISTFKKYQDTIKIILLDIIMPSLDYYTMDETNGGTTTGLRLLNDIREIAPQIPIIVISIKRLKSIDQYKIKFNISEIIEKPFEIEELIDKINNIIK